MCGWAWRSQAWGQRPAWQDARRKARCGPVQLIAAPETLGCAGRWRPLACLWEEAPLKPGALLWVIGQMQWMFVWRQAGKKRPMSCWSRQKDIQVFREKQLVRWWWGQTAQAEFWLCHFQGVAQWPFVCVCASSPQVTVTVLTRRRPKPAQAQRANCWIRTVVS